MKRYSKDKIYELLEEQGVLPMFCHQDLDVCKGFLQALYNGGARLVEFTNRNPNALEIFSALKKYAEKYNLPYRQYSLGDSLGKHYQLLKTNGVTEDIFEETM